MSVSAHRTTRSGSIRGGDCDVINDAIDVSLRTGKRDVTAVMLGLVSFMASYEGKNRYCFRWRLSVRARTPTYWSEFDVTSQTETRLMLKARSPWILVTFDLDSDLESHLHTFVNRTINVECSDRAKSFLVRRYISRMSMSHSSFKVVGSRSCTGRKITLTRRFVLS